MAKVGEISEVRKALLERSKVARALRADGMEGAQSAQEYAYWEQLRINDILRERIYQLGGVELKTFAQWRREGATIRRGSRAFAFWGQPIRATAKAEPIEREEEEAEEYEYWPICLLFTAQQVITPAERRKAEKAPQREPVAECLTLDEVL